MSMTARHLLLRIACPAAQSPLEESMRRLRLADTPHSRTVRSYEALEGRKN
jgi:hypothetical protein